MYILLTKTKRVTTTLVKSFSLVGPLVGHEPRSQVSWGKERGTTIQPISYTELLYTGPDTKRSSKKSPLKRTVACPRVTVFK